MGLKELFQSSAIVLKKDYFQGKFEVLMIDYLLEALLPVLHICCLPSENAPLGLWPRAAFSRPRSQFSLYRPTLSWQITHLFFSSGKLAYK